MIMGDTLEDNGADHQHQSPSLHGQQRFYKERLSLRFGERVVFGGIVSFLGGASLGIAHGGKMAGMRFRAEHAHIFPSTTTGWYFYHKSKNHNVVLGAVKAGLKMGTRVAFWTTSFLVAEEAVDHWRGRIDFLSSVIAGLCVSGGFSAWSMTC